MAPARTSASPCARTRRPSPQHPGQDAPGTTSLLVPEENTGGRTGAAGPNLTRGARGLPPLGWPAGHREAAAGVPGMLLLRCRCPDARRQHHFAAASASSCSVLSAAPPRQPPARPAARAARRGGVGSGGASSSSCTRRSSGGSPSTEPRSASPAKAPASATDKAVQPIAASARAARGGQSERQAQGFPPPLLSRLVSGRGGDAAGFGMGEAREGRGLGTPGSRAEGGARPPGPPRWAWGAIRLPRAQGWAKEGAQG